MGMGNPLRDYRRLMRSLWPVSAPVSRPFCAFHVPDTPRAASLTRIFGAVVSMSWRRREGTYSLVDWGGAGAICPS